MSDQATPTPSFTIEKLYLKDLSVEVPRAPECFLEQQTPAVQVEMGTAAKRLDEVHYEVVLTLTVKAEVEGRPLFLVEVTYGGVFQLRHIPEQEVEPLLFVACPNILYPYAREIVSDASTRSGFQPVILAPVNFEALYIQQRAQAEQAPTVTTPQ